MEIEQADKNLYFAAQGNEILKKQLEQYGIYELYRYIENSQSYHDATQTKRQKDSNGKSR